MQVIEEDLYVGLIATVLFFNVSQGKVDDRIAFSHSVLEMGLVLDFDIKDGTPTNCENLEHFGPEWWDLDRDGPNKHRTSCKMLQDGRCQNAPPVCPAQAISEPPGGKFT